MSANGGARASRPDFGQTLRFTVAATIAVFACAIATDAAEARRLHVRHHRYVRNPVIIPNGPAAAAGTLFGLVDTGISPATDAYPGFVGVPPGYGFYGRGYHGPGYGSPGY